MERADLGAGDVFEAGLAAFDVVANLIDERQVIAQASQASVSAPLGSLSAVHWAMIEASILSVLARLSLNWANALTCLGWNTLTMKPASRKAAAIFAE